MSDNYKDLYSKIRDAFPQLADFAIKYIDKDFPNEFNEINSLEDLDDRGSNILEISFTAGPLSSIVSENGTPPPLPPQRNNTLNLTSTNDINIFENELSTQTALEGPSSSLNLALEEQINDAVDMSDAEFLPSWPYPFLVTDDMVRTSVLRKLENKVLLTGKDRSFLFAGMYDACTKYLGRDPYPGRKYSDMVNAILRRWPYLHRGVSYQEGFETYKKALKEHFRNKKRGIKKGVNPKVDAMKLKFNSKNKAIKDLIDNTADHTSKDEFGVANFAPDRYPGLDQVAIDYFLNTMMIQSELDVHARDQPALDLAMDKTFPERRRMLVKEMCPLRLLLDTYPLLRGKEELLKEFTRITGIDAIEKFPAILTNAANIIKIGLEKKIKKVLEMNSIITNDQENIFDQTNFLGISAILSIPLILKEKIGAFIAKTDSELNHPRIICETYDAEVITTLFQSERFVVMVESNVLFETKDICEAFLVMFASYYVFNLSYPLELDATLTFFQRSIFKVGDSAKLKQKVLTLIASLATMQ